MTPVGPRIWVTIRQQNPRVRCFAVDWDSHGCERDYPGVFHLSTADLVSLHCWDGEMRRVSANTDRVSLTMHQLLILLMTILAWLSHVFFISPIVDHSSTNPTPEHNLAFVLNLARYDTKVATKKLRVGYDVTLSAKRPFSSVQENAIDRKKEDIEILADNENIR